MNELSQSTSPYLLQHAANPVHWKPWSSAALLQAQNQNKLLIISVGYSACHWCHVMEHETFEDNEAALVMNRHFISIKVDREERPDVDAVYMKAVQIMTRHGGWPMNVVALPDGRPVWGGTYFRKAEWIQTLEQLQLLWENEPEKLFEYAGKLHEAVERISLPIAPIDQPKPAKTLLPELVAKWKRSFDHEFGGMARAPKFMMPSNYRFLLRYAYEHKDAELLEFVNLTLTRMAWGGLFDTVGGGFARYSVDVKWHVPHFEKMLYDNGQLVALYAEAFRLTQNPLYQEVIKKTLSFVDRELSNGEGGFYSALDADSLDQNGKLKEGAYYIWTVPELKNLLGEDFRLFSEVFNLNDFGHWEQGHYVLIQNDGLDRIAQRHQLPTERVQQKKGEWEALLLQARNLRSYPRLDDKTLASWNGLMVRGYAEAFKALQLPAYREQALSAGTFLLNQMTAPEGHLFRTYKNGIPAINAYLEDYAFTIDAFIALYEITFDESWLSQAKKHANSALDHFYDNHSGFFRFKSNQDDPLIAAHFEIEDNVIPSSNAMMAENLHRLGIYYRNLRYEQIASSMTARVLEGIDHPSAFSNWMNLSISLEDQSREVAVTGPDALKKALELQTFYLPLVLFSAAENPSDLPFLKNRHRQNQLLFYCCQNKVCELPTPDIQKAKTALNLNRW